MTNLLSRLTKLEVQSKPQPKITGFKMIADSEVDQHHEEMLKAGYRLVNPHGGIFVLWEPVSNC